MENVVINEGFRVAIKNSVWSLMLYLLFTFGSYSSFIKYNQGILTSLCAAIVGFLLLRFFTFEKTIITDLHIKQFSFFLLKRKEIKISEIKSIEILDLSDTSSGYNYSLWILGNNTFRLHFISLNSLKTFISAMEKHNIKLKIDDSIIIN